MAIEHSGARVDWSRLMQQLDGDLGTICEIVEAYALETRESLAALPERVAEGRADEVRRHAHGLAGTMRMFALADAERIARRLETLAAAGSLDGAPELVGALVAAAAGILPELDRFVASGGASAR